MPWYLYIVRCDDGCLYTGITTNVDRRVLQHNSGQGAKSIVKSKRPVKLSYIEKYQSQITAAKREKEIKGWSKKKKLVLISKKILGKSKRGLP